MRKEVRGAAARFIKEIETAYPDVTADMLDDQTFSADVWVRIKCKSHEQVNEVMEEVAHLTTKYYLNERVYIQASATYTGPVDLYAR